MEVTAQKTSRPSPSVLYALLGLMGLGTVLRLFRLGQWSLWYDECASIYLTRYVGLHLALFDDANTTEPPLLAVLVRIWKALIESVLHFPATSTASDFAYRMLPVLFGVAVMPALFVLARHLTRSSGAALWAVALYAVSPFHVYYAQELRIYTFLTLMGLLAFYCMIRALEEDRPRYWIGLVACLAIMMYSHFISMWYIFACGVFFLLVLPWYRRHFWKWTAWFALLMVLIAPALLMAFRMNAHVLTIKYHWYENPTIKTGLVTLKNLLAGYSANSAVYWPLFLLGMVLAFWGLFWLFRRQPVAALFVVALVFVPVFGNVALWAYRDFSFYEHRLFILSGAVLLIPMGMGLHQLPGQAAKVFVATVFAALSTLTLVDYYRQNIHPLDGHRLGINHKVDFRSVARFLNEKDDAESIVVYANHFMVYSFHHYLDRPHHHVGLPPNPGQIMIDTMGNPLLLAHHDLLAKPVDNVTEDFQKVWFVESHGITFEYKPLTEQVRGWFEAGWTRANDFTFEGLTVTLYTRNLSEDGKRTTNDAGT